MKNTYFYIILFYFSSLLVSAQNEKKPENVDLLKNRQKSVLKTGAFCSLWGSIPLTSEYRLVYEIPTSSQSSAQIGISYLGKNFWLWPMMDTILQANPQASQITVNGFRFQMAFKYYFVKGQLAPEGLYIGPFLSYSMATVGTTYSNLYQSYLKAVFMNANLILGYQYIYLDNIAFDFYVGLGYKQNSLVEYQSGQLIKRYDLSEYQIFPTPVKVVMGLNVGIAF